MTATSYDVVIGLEVHAELRTATKMFCGCPNRFGAEPNTNVCPVCLGLPGALPVTNAYAVELAIRFGLAVDSEIGRAIFHRKNYFYPDMPKDFQISQYDEPICRGGEVTTIDETGKTHVVQLERAHLEEDTGKSRHIGGDGRIHGADYSLIDYNRAGVPLLEIVTTPNIASPPEARAYVNELRAILELLDVSDVKMEQGSLRVDANVSLRRSPDDELGTKVEIKNMNSVRSVARALEYEIDRQADLLDAGTAIVQETRGWDEAAAVTHSMRSKEMAFDYRYFPEPDLAPIKPKSAWIERISPDVPEVLPAQRVSLISERSGVAAELVRAVVYTPGMADWIDAEIDGGADAKQSFNWATQEVLAHMNERDMTFAELDLAPGAFVELDRLVTDGTLSKKLAREVVGEMLTSGDSPRSVVERKGLAQISDSGELEAVVAEVVDANPDAIEKLRGGNDKIVGFLVGQVMKATRGKANPASVSKLVRDAAGR